MSRRRGPGGGQPEYIFGGIRLRCPDGHQLGLVVKQRGMYLLDAGLEREVGQGHSKIKTTCGRCEASGVHRDLQGSWDKIRQLLDESEQDRHAGPRDYVIG